MLAGKNAPNRRMCPISFYACITSWLALRQLNGLIIKNMNAFLGPRDPELVLYVPDMEEIRISPVVARKGYLNVLEHKTHGWKKRWVVSILIVHYSNVHQSFFDFNLLIRNLSILIPPLSAEVATYPISY